MKRKKIIVAVIVFFIGIFYCYNVPDYRITNAFAFSSNNFRRTELKVIVYRFWDVDNIIKKIEEENTRINGKPTILQLDLFYPEFFFWYNEKAFKIIVCKN